jgi:hypothetical protein
MKVFVKESNHAWKWINNGYASAWESLGHEVHRYSSGISGDDLEEAILMVSDFDLDVKNVPYDIFERCKHVFMFVSPNTFPKPWCDHSNYISPVAKNKEVVSKINDLDNVTFWTFLKTDNNDYYKLWRQVEHIPLAFDSINYDTDPTEEKIYDVCYIGGWADNGFNSKKKIMKGIFSEFMKSDLKCGFFINKGLTNEEEAKIIKSSKVCLNIHDDYQKILGLDLNERVFKTLGLNGNIVVDYGEHSKLLGEVVNYVTTPHDSDSSLVGLASFNAESHVYAITDPWANNREKILTNHTYVSRVKQMIECIK